jgi:GntR family transcriptional regulator/MocR family aminotransferase
MSGTDFLQLDPAVAPVRGLTTWLADQLRAAIIDGRLRTGTALPATRILADELDVSRGIVVEAYQRLKDEGMVRARHGAGTVVTGRPAAEPAATEPAATEPAATEPAATGSAATGSAATGQSGAGHATTAPAATATVSFLPRRWRADAEIDLSPGVPDLSGFPRAAWLRAERTVLNQASAADLGYGDPSGSDRLRHELSGWLARARGLRARPEDIIIVTGVAQALALLAQWLRDHGRPLIAVEDPGSRGARDELAYWGLKPVPVSVDERGLRADELAHHGGDARSVLLTPAHQFPTGVVLAPERRHDLLTWAAAADAVIIEDDYDAEYRYDRTPVPAMQASAPGHVAYTGSVSKTLAPGLRLGWLIPPAALHADLVTAKHASDLGSPALPQLVLAQLIASGDLEQHIRHARRRQRGRRDVLLAAVREHLPGAQVQGIAAGLHVLITFPGLAGQVRDSDLADRIREAGVLVQPLSVHGARNEVPSLVMGYAAHTADQLRTAVSRIGQVLS